MYIPDKIKIGGHDITVTKNYTFRERDDLLGLACIHQKTIYLVNGDPDPYPQSQIDENFVHELLHHIAYQATGNPNLFDDELKHKVVAHVLYQVLKDNRLKFFEEVQGAGKVPSIFTSPELSTEKEK